VCSLTESFMQVSDHSEARVLTRDHKPSSNSMELERLKALGATLSLDGYVQLQVGVGVVWVWCGCGCGCG